jgi:DNA-binding transcriptional MerR regulator|uniref:MerR family transcriptional regulator n=1 Tax=candidate division WOR-3 bacterium TaxID=2052148 RepID=A0A7V3PTV1_UNCW3
MSRKKFYSLAEACRILKIPAYTLRYWEKEFEFKFQRNSAGRRIIADEQLKKLELIQHLLHREKMTIKGAKKKLQAMSMRATEPPQSRDSREVLLWLKKELIGLRTLLETGAVDTAGQDSP